MQKMVHLVVGFVSLGMATYAARKIDLFDEQSSLGMLVIAAMLMSIVSFYCVFGRKKKIEGD